MIAPNSTVKLLSLPARGAWIEIGYQGVIYIRIPSLPARGAWIEISKSKCAATWDGSLPARGAWIEIISRRAEIAIHSVAPRTGSVD